MDTRTIELSDGVEVDVCRMPPAMMYSFSAMYRRAGLAEDKAKESKEARVARGRKIVEWIEANEDLHRLIFEGVFPTCIQEVRIPTEPPEVYSRTNGTPCVTEDATKAVDGILYLADLGIGRVTSLVIELMAYTNDGDASFRGREGTAASPQGKGGAAGKANRDAAK